VQRKTGKEENTQHAKYFIFMPFESIVFFVTNYLAAYFLISKTLTTGLAGRGYQY